MVESEARLSVLVIGGGGREHAIVEALLLSCSDQIPPSSPRLQRIYWSPGNGVSDSLSDNVQVCKVEDGDEVAFCKNNGISLVLVGPEAPLENGICDRLEADGIACFGPSKAAAEIECSKAFAKDFMLRHKLPTAQYQVFSRATTSKEDLKQFFSSDQGFEPLVVKASGLAAGKGVLVAESTDVALQETQRLLFEDGFGAAADTVVVEERLVGREVSALCFTDGVTVHMMPLAQDHKRLLDNDQGPNTGGMGAFSPFTAVDTATRRAIKQLLQRTVDCLREEGRRYVGVLYAGLMLTDSGPKLLEFNCRFGDPETQVLLSLLNTRLLDICLACVRGSLAELPILWNSSLSSCVVVVAVKGYPEAYPKGLKICGIDDALRTDKSVKIFHAGTSRRGEHFVTAGGRVLNVLACALTLDAARQVATDAAACIRFVDDLQPNANLAYHRKDIAHSGVCNKKKLEVPLCYANAGVSVDAGNQLVSRIKQLCAATRRSGCERNLIGGFGALFDLKAAGFADPLLVMGTDGVGTKLEIARETGDFSTIGVDLVAMCANDVLCHGATPLAFLDYYVTGRLQVDRAAQVVAGIADGCRQIGCALIGGETAEMPGMYGAEQLDIAGFCVGAIDRAKRDPPLPHSDMICEGDVVFGFSSSGLHSNGFSLVRKIIEKCQLSVSDICPWDETISLGGALLKPTRLYVQVITKYLETVGYSGGLKAIAHITGGGLIENITRILPDHFGVQLDAMSWPIDDVFKWLHLVGPVTADEMARTFNCGVGLVAVVSKADADNFPLQMQNCGERVHKIGAVTENPSDKRAVIDNLESALYSARCAALTKSASNSSSATNGTTEKKRVGILISGSGTNMSALIRYSERSDCSYRVAFVLSNVATAKGLTTAEGKGIETLVIPHKGKKREAFDAEVDTALRSRGIEYVCLAGFMRVLSGWFVSGWRGRLLNVHPSLLPSFKGAHAHREVLQSGVRLTGCTVHFVEEDVDSGAIVEQAAVPVLPGDTEESLSERVKVQEHRILPLALHSLASGAVLLDLEANVVIRSC